MADKQIRPKSHNVSVQPPPVVQSEDGGGVWRFPALKSATETVAAQQFGEQVGKSIAAAIANLFGGSPNPTRAGASLLNNR